MQVQWEGVAFESEAVAVTVPIDRAGHTAAVIGNRLYIFGGANRTGLHFNDVFYYSFEEKCWSRVQITDTMSKYKPKPRNGHSGCATSDCDIHFFGGIMQMPQQMAFNDMFKFTAGVSDGTWTLIQQHGDIPCARSGHAMCCSGEYVYILGGSDPYEEKVMNDMYAFSLGSSTWTSIDIESGPVWPTPREMHSLNFINGTMVLIGGRGEISPLNIMVGKLGEDPLAISWTNLKSTGPELTCMAHAAAVIDQKEDTLRVLVVGGIDTSGKKFKCLDDVLLNIDISSGSYQQEGIDGDAMIVCGRQRFAHTLTLYQGSLYAVGGSELTIDEADQPLKVPISLYLGRIKE